MMMTELKSNNNFVKIFMENLDCRYLLIHINISQECRIVLLVQSLSFIFENSLQSGEVSVDWKKDNAACIFKKGRKDKSRN